MKLGDLIHEYKLNNKMSMSDLAKKSGISKPYVSMLEADKNSNGGKPVASTVETLQKADHTVAISLDELLRKLGDKRIEIRPLFFHADEAELVDGYFSLSDEGKLLAKNIIGQLFSNRLVVQAQCINKVATRIS